MSSLSQTSSLSQRYYKGVNMKLTEQAELEVKLLEQQIRFYLMVNGLIAGGFFIGIIFALYKVMKVIIE